MPADFAAAGLVSFEICDMHDTEKTLPGRLKGSVPHAAQKRWVAAGESAERVRWKG